MPVTDPHQAETDRVYAEHDAARAAWENDRTDPLVRARYDRAMAAVQQLREFWRGVGVATGTRTNGPKTTDNETSAPALVKGR